jgi:hypothetical protein
LPSLQDLESDLISIDKAIRPVITHPGENRIEPEAGQGADNELHHAHFDAFHERASNHTTHERILEETNDILEEKI